MGSSPIRDAKKKGFMRIATHVAYVTVIAAMLISPTIAQTSENDSVATPSVVFSDELHCFDVVHEDRSVEKTDGSNRDRFFSIDRFVPSFTDNVPDPTPELSWDSRVAQCDSLSAWEDFQDCMWRPWLFGF